MGNQQQYISDYFFCDLDHTILYSHRIDMNCGKYVVEHLNGKAQSFMTAKTFNYLKNQKSVEFIPVSTRTIEQYKRITAFQSIIPVQYALVCNGGILLINGTVDEHWYTESLTIISEEIEELKRAKAILERLLPGKIIHDVNSLFCYAKSDAPEVLCSQLKQELNPTQINILCDNRKVYCIPNSLNKGNAIKRFKNRFDVPNAIAAGDSIFDVSMLNTADTALFPPDIQPLIKAKKKICVSTPFLSDGICTYLETL